jgi:two-component system, cell cycle sensor histidine kinase and response regulator CckA
MYKSKPFEQIDSVGVTPEENVVRLAAIIESSEDAIIGTNLNGVVEIWNAGAEKLYGYSRSEMLGRPMSVLLPSDRPDEEAEILHKIQSGERVHHFDTVRLRKGGEPVHVSITISPIRNRDGLITGASHVARDITERLTYERAMAQLAAVVESSEEAIIGNSVEGIIESWNAGASRLYGYTAEEVLGRSMIMLLPPDHPDEERDILSRIRSGERVEQLDTLRMRKDGQKVRVSLTVSPIRNAKGEIIGASHITRDITARTAHEQAISQLSALVESSDDAIISKNLDGIILTWNTAAERIYGYKDLEVKWRPMTILIPPDRPNEEMEILERLKRGERVDHLETVRVRKDGKPIDVFLTISPIRNATGEIIGASHIARDITERKRFQSQLQQKQRIEDLGLLAGGVAHDFNNLLTGILGNASLALELLSLHHPAHTRMTDVMKAGERAARLTRQLLAYAGKGRFVTETIDLSKLVEEISCLVESSISKKVQLRLELDRTLPPIEGDSGQLQQVVMNLVINGAEAIGDKVGSVIVRTQLQDVDEVYTRTVFAEVELPYGKYVKLEVHDTGCGMDEETMAKIFHPFFTTKSAGRGLGLAAVMGIVRGHRGALKVYSSPSQGSTFKVLFPIHPHPPAETPEHATSEPMQGYGRVLVVDDEELIRDFAKATLEYYGYTVQLASNGQEAIDIFTSAPDDFRLVCLDLTMPVMNGEEVFRRLKMIRPDIPVLLSSGFNESEAIRHFTGKKLAGFIQKPFSEAQLAEQVRASLQQ